MATISDKPLAGGASGGQMNLEDEQPRFSRRETLLTMISVLLVMLLASLDQTIVGTAMPKIVAEFNGLEHYAWVTTAYMLASTVLVPIYGKLSDLFGRKIIIVFGVVVFLIGSGLCGAAQSMEQLIIFRALQGVGAGALMPVAIAIIGDLFPPRERGKWQGVTGAVFGLSSVLGPLLGGWITDNSSWRWVFYVNLPVGLIALPVLIFLMPNLMGKSAKVRIDFIGALLLIAWAIPLLLGFTWSSDYGWLSWQVLSLFGGTVVFLAAFLTYEGYLERRKLQPIIEPGLFKNNIFSVSSIVTFILGIGMFGSILYIPLYAQGVLEISATNSGLILTPMMLALVVGSVISGQLVSRIGKYKLICVVGMIISIGGALLLLRLDAHSQYTDILLAMVVLGLGMGTGMALYTLIVQNALPKKIGQATSALTFMRSIGSTIGLAAMGSIMNAAYAPAFDNALNGTLKGQLEKAGILEKFHNANILLNPQAKTQIHQGLQQQLGPAADNIFAQILEAMKVGLSEGVHSVFLVSTVVLVVALVALLFLKEIQLIGGAKKSSTNEDGSEEIVDAPSSFALH